MTDNPYDLRKPGEPLWPENESFSLPNLSKIKATSERDWEALYQGNPVALAGDIFAKKNFGYWYPYKERHIPDPIYIEGSEQPQPLIELPHFSELGSYALSGDLAFKGREDSDSVALGVWVTAGPREFLIDQIAGKLGFLATLDAIYRLLVKHPLISAILIEDAANGPAVMETLQARFSGVIARPTGGGKVARAISVTPWFESHSVFFPHPKYAPWVAALVNEMVRFPQSADDDQVDQLTHYLAWRVGHRSALDRLRDLGRM